MEKSQNKDRYIPYAVSIAAFLAALIALGVSTPRLIKTDNCGNVDLGFDYLGVIVALLALMVTLMVGWNIWQTIDAKNAIKDFEEKTKNYEQDLQNKVDAVKTELQGQLDSRESALYNHVSALLYQTI